MPSPARLFVALSLLPACAYRPGSLTVPESGPDAGQLRTVGCLDFAIRPFDDPEAEGPAVALTFANRCDQAVVVDLGAIRATGVFRGGRRVAISAYDPERELRRATLDARTKARENIEYAVPASMTEQPLRLCLDLSGADPGARDSRPVIACVRATNLSG